MCSNKLTEGSFPLLSFQSGSKNVNGRQYLGIGVFHIQLRVQMNVLKKTFNKYGENNLSKSKLHLMSVERELLEIKKQTNKQTNKQTAKPLTKILFDWMLDLAEDLISQTWKVKG